MGIIKRLIRNRDFCHTVVIFGIAIIFNYLVLQFLFALTDGTSSWEHLFSAIKGGIFVAVVAFAASRGGFKGGMACGAIIGLTELFHDISLVNPDRGMEILTTYVVFAPAGVILSWLIGSRKEADNKLRNAYVDLEVAQRLTKIGSWKWIISSNKVTWSFGLCEILKYDVNLPVPPFVEMERFYTPESWRRLNELVTRTFNTGEPYEVELEEIRTDGVKINTLTRGEVKRDANGKIENLHGTVQDITELKNKEAKLKESEVRYRTLSETAAEGILAADMETRKFVYANPAICKMLGYSYEELLKMSVIDIHPKDSLEQVLADFDSLARAERDNVVVPCLKKDGKVVDVNIVAAASTINGRLCNIGFFTDITESKKLQEQLMAQDRLASIGQLVSGVAHELNNPMTSVVGFSDLLLQRDLPSDIKGDLEIINSEAKRTAKIVQNLLTFSRQAKEDKVLLDIQGIIDRVLALRAHELKVNNINIITHYTPDLPQIKGNASQVQQVFLNLIVNAEQAMLETHKKGALTVTTERLGDNVRVSVSDDGPGIKPENMKKLFTPFFTTKGVGKGTGLGLSISHGIITALGGRIYAESEPGKGATFIVEMPIYKTPGSSLAVTR